jgi:hypothetical protein
VSNKMEKPALNEVRVETANGGEGANGRTVVFQTLETETAFDADAVASELHSQAFNLAKVTRESGNEDLER